MFKKREKKDALIKRTLEDRYEEQEEEVDASVVELRKRPKLSAAASTRDNALDRQRYIEEEVQEMRAFKTAKGLEKVENAATRHLEIDTPEESDAIAKAKANIEISKAIREGKIDPNVYRGLHGYANYFEQTEEDLRHKKFSGTLGPVRAPTFIRNTTRVDYNPERCKDYYETGRCNFGDSCIFIHDRSDYKSGW
jgi:RING finger protein 113A